MRLISLKSLKIGERLGTGIRSQDGHILLAARATVTEGHINRLGSFGISTVYVEDELFDEVELRTAITDETKTKALKAVGDVLSQINTGKSLYINTDGVKQAAGEIAADVRKSLNYEPIGLFNTYAVTDARALHAVNVSCITSALALACGCTIPAIAEYAQAALLHDMSLGSLEFDRTDNFEHAVTAMELLKKGQKINPRTYTSVAMHHENFDGTGKPKGVKGDSIQEGARIISVADMYDNVVNGYAGYQKLSYNYAVEYINSRSGIELDPKMVAHFNKNVAIYPTGATVLLNNGFKAVVVGQNENFPARPRVRLIMPNKEDCLMFNMMTHSTLFIESVDL
ncbi:c-di-GMP phosphodiesterase [Clostridia bacterium]|nr:c-di-GMP phosphodiesterase [Clostridia bacterium]